MASSTSAGGQVLALFWDIQNCPVPDDKKASRVVYKLQEKFLKEGVRLKDMLVVCDVLKERQDVLNSLSEVGVDVQHVSSQMKNSADEKLRVAMRKYVDENAGNFKTILVLISGDSDFLSDISEFRLRKGVHTILLHNDVAKEDFKLAANEAYNFTSLLDDVPTKQPWQKDPFQFTELKLTNLPNLPRDELTRQVQMKCRAWQGTVRHVDPSEGFAVIKFDSGAKAEKAKRNLVGEKIDGRTFEVDFNRHRWRARSSSPRSRPPPASAFAETSKSNLSAASGTQMLLPSKLPHAVTTRLENRSRSAADVKQCAQNFSADVEMEDIDDLTSTLTSLDIAPATNPSAGVAEQSTAPADSALEEEVLLAIRCISTAPMKCFEEHVKTALRDCGVRNTRILQVDSPSQSCYVEVADAKEALRVVEDIDDTTFDSHPLVAEFADRRLGLVAKSEAILSGKMTWSDFQEAYYKRYKQKIALQDIRSLPNFHLEIRPGDSTIHISNKAKIDLKIDNGAQMDHEADHERIPYCHYHDRRTKLSPVLSTIATKVRLRDLCHLLNVTLETHGGEFPLESSLFCLNAARTAGMAMLRVVENKDGGVPLEQLVEATGIAEVFVKNNAAFVRRKQQSDRPRPVKTEELKEIERMILAILEKEPFHRIAAEDLPDRFSFVFNCKIDSILKRYGTIESLLALFPNVFNVVGLPQQPQIVLTHSMQMINLLLVVRKILAGLPESERYLSIRDESKLPRLFQHHFRLPFSPVNFGLCYTEDLFIARSQQPQNVVDISENSVKISEALASFVSRAAQVFSTCDGWTCGVAEFEAKFTSRFGPFSVADFGYSHVADLFDEFTCDLSVIRSDAAVPSLLLSLSDSKRLSSLESSFVDLLKSFPEQAILESNLQAAFLNMFKTNLTPIVHLIKAKPASWSHLIECFGAQTKLSLLSNQGADILYLRNGVLLNNFEKRAMSVLYFRDNNTLPMFVPELHDAFLCAFGKSAHFLFDHLRALAEGQRAILLHDAVGGRSAFCLRPHVIVLCRMALMLHKAGDKSLPVELVSEGQSSPSDNEGHFDDARRKAIRIEQKVLNSFAFSTLDDFFECVEDFILLARKDLRGRTGPAFQQAKENDRSMCLSRGGRFFVSLSSLFPSSLKQSFSREAEPTVTKKGANRLMASFHSVSSEVHSEVD